MVLYKYIKPTFLYIIYKIVKGEKILANYVKFRRGTLEAFKNLGNRIEQDTLYFIYEEDESTAELYLGSKLISGGDGTSLS